MIFVLVLYFFLLIDSVFYYYGLAKMLPEPFFPYYFCWICLFLFFCFVASTFCSKNYSSLSSLILVIIISCITLSSLLLPSFFRLFWVLCWFGLLQKKRLTKIENFTLLAFERKQIRQSTFNSSNWTNIYDRFFLLFCLVCEIRDWLNRGTTLK